MTFRAPISDQRLTLNAVVGIAELENGPDADMVDAVLEGAAALAEGEFAPLDRIGDTVGARWNNGTVTMPDGFRNAWNAFVEGGWMTLAAPEHHGGQGAGPAATSRCPCGRPRHPAFHGVTPAKHSGHGRVMPAH